jgi:hypothetical protein
MHRWKIDTLDPRGGLAFATWREDDLIADVPAAADTPCIFVGAPEFRPEAVSNRSVALGAGRAAFQTGFFHGEGATVSEVAFPSPEAVAEFVRRTYIRSGGGDGAEGGPSTSPRRPVPSASEFLYALRKTPLHAEIMDRIREFRTLSKMPDGVTAPAKVWEKLQPKVEGATETPAMLAAALVNLIYEMYRRLPDAAMRDLLLDWQCEAQHLRDLVTQLDLWPLLVSPPCFDALRELARSVRPDELDKDPAASSKDVENNHDWPFFLLFILLPQCDPARWVEGYRLYRRFRHWPERYMRRNFEVPLDPMTSLWRLPLPEHLEHYVGAALKGTRRANLYNALTAFLGSPTVALPDGEELVELALFASACIAGPSTGRPLRLIGWEMGVRPGRTAYVDASARKLALRGWTWMREQLPKLVFPEHVESAIQSAADLTYA